MNDKSLEILIHYPLSEDQLNSLKTFSDNLNISHYPDTPLDEIPEDVKTRAEVLLTKRLVPSPEMMSALRWIQYTLAGIDFAKGSPLFDREGFQATTLSGAVACKVAEYALMAMLSLGHKLPLTCAYQSKKIWPPDRWESLKAAELHGSTVGLLGYGSIAREIARLLQPFNVEILATKKNLMELEDTGYMPAGLGDPEGVLFKRLYPPEAIVPMLKLCDFVVVCLPLTADTTGAIGKKELAAMKKTAYLVALGRGGQVNEQALAEALREGRIAGAMLDVFETEPLPKESPLWEVPNLAITPHVAGNTSRYDQLVYDLFTANLSRYMQGEALYNPFVPERGY
ncbi:MAG: D-2-hydroxyacid dehydrogenase [Chloroflexi bacterium]|nr:D-2-hydroxyacid dehydrogenase [Chloroflexota bacterium]